MKRLALVLALLAQAGCKDRSGTEQAKIIDQKGNQSVGGGGQGGLGAVQAVRKAAARTVNDHDLGQLQLFITTAIDASGGNSMIDANQIMQEIRQAGNIVKLIQDEVIILTNTKDINGVWAYTQWPQRAGDHYVIKRGGREQMNPGALRQALQAQGSQVKMSE